jgi:hypothetical protein
VLLLVACRQPNPEWKGADEGLATSDTLPSSSDTSDGPMSQTSSPADSATEGEHCNNDNQCPDGWVCGPVGCQQGGDGDPCTGAGDCMPPAGICGPTDTCQDGSDGDPCSGDSDCTDPSPLCSPQGTCQDGSDGDPCSDDEDCTSPVFCGPTGACQDGSDGDACSGDSDCSETSPLCGPTDACQDGSAGDACSGISDCADGLACTAAVCG